MAENDQDRTEAPTPRRREEERQEGNVARSQDLTAAASLLAAVVLLYALGLRMLMGFKINLQTMLTAGLSDNPTRLDDAGRLVAYTGRVILAAAGPMMLAVAAVVLVVSLTQVGAYVSFKPLQPNFAKLSPWRGLQNMFNARAAVRLAMSIGKVLVIGGVAAWVVVDDLPDIVGLIGLEPMPMLATAGYIVFLLALKLAALLLVLAILDYAFQRSQHERDMRMTKQEIKEEMKRMEGDPLMKQRRARVARQLSLQRIAQAVPKADVVVTNPTHFAVALQYDAQSMRAPKVVAKGADYLAQRIRQIAMANDVPLVERRELARGLYFTVEVGDEVGPQFYGPVAEILAYVYRLGGRRSA